MEFESIIMQDHLRTRIYINKGTEYEMHEIYETEKVRILKGSPNTDTKYEFDEKTFISWQIIVFTMKDKAYGGFETYALKYDDLSICEQDYKTISQMIAKAKKESELYEDTI